MDNKGLEMPPQTQAPNPLDIQARAALADAAASMSPQSALLAWADWASHLAISPGKQSELAALALEQAAALAGYLRECLMTGPGEARDCIAPPAQDRRFAELEWRRWPFNLWHQGFLLNQRWWEAATHGVAGVESVLSTLRGRTVGRAAASSCSELATATGAGLSRLRLAIF